MASQKRPGVCARGSSDHSHKFLEHLGQQINHGWKTFRLRPRKAPRIRGQVHFDMWHFHFHISSTVAPGTCLSLIHWSAICPEMSYTPWWRHSGWIYYHHPGRGTGRGGNHKAVPWGCGAGEGRRLPRKPWSGLSLSTLHNKIHQSAFWVHVNIVQIR